MEPGIHDLSTEQYHADPGERPSLSAHIAQILLTRSPKHAWTASPRLNPDYERTERDSFDLGTAVHDLWLRGKEDTVLIVEANDWRTKYAQERKAEARDADLIPLLAKDWQRVREMTDALREQLDARDDDPPLFAEGGKPEQTLIWQERGVACRALVDWLHSSYACIDDLKSTGVSANPFSWTRTTMWNIGADIEAVFHSRGVKAIIGKEPLFRFVVIETRAPYALSVISLAPSALALANDKVDKAIDTWKRCLETDEWPAYTKEICYAEAPPWSENQWLEQQAIEEAA